MADGTTKPISEIEPGDEVLATDPDTGEYSSQAVTAILAHQDTLVDLQVEQEVPADVRGVQADTGVLTTVSTTAGHPFWNHTDQAWQAVTVLDPGDRLLTADGSRLSVVGLLDHTRRVATAYNLTVDTIHTYHVAAGDAAVLVHNAGPPGPCRLTSSPTSPTMPSHPIWKNQNRTMRVEVENPRPGAQGSANIHLQFMGRGADPTKYYYNPTNGTWVSAHGTVLSSRVAQQIPQSAINRAYQYLGIP